MEYLGFLVLCGVALAGSLVCFIVVKRLNKSKVISKADVLDERVISEISGDPSVFIQNAERKKNLEQRRRLIIKKVLDIDSDAPADDVAIQAIACKMEAESFISDYPEELDS